MYQISIGEKEFKVVVEGEKLLVDHQPIAWNLVKISDNFYHLLVRGRSYELNVVHWDRENKLLTLKLNNKLAELTIKTGQDLLLEKLGLNHLQQQKISEIKAPMPGLILEVSVTEGQKVEKGDILLVLEAMKMENAIKSPHSGEVKKVMVSKGQGVEKNQLLIQF